MSHLLHEAVHGGASVRCGVLTCSDSRSEETDTSGRLIRELLIEGGHAIPTQRIIPDVETDIEQAIADAQNSCEALLITGGTGIAPRDRTVDVVERLVRIRLPGFGELFRSLSFAEIGPAAMASRATAGVVGEMLVFALPGSTGAVRLGMERLILPQLPHLVALLRS